MQVSQNTAISGRHFLQCAGCALTDRRAASACFSSTLCFLSLSFGELPKALSKSWNVFFELKQGLSALSRLKNYLLKTMKYQVEMHRSPVREDATRSTKHKIQARSTEAELIAAEECTTYVTFLRKLCQEGECCFKTVVCGKKCMGMYSLSVVDANLTARMSAA